jgi:thioredoxin 1
MTKVTEENFDEFTFDSSLPALVFFGSKRCKICKELAPVILAIADENAHRLNVCWVDVDKYKPLFQRFRLQGIPHLLLFNKGEVRERIGGVHPKEVLVAVIDRVLDTGCATAETGKKEVIHSDCTGCCSC